MRTFYKIDYPNAGHTILVDGYPVEFFDGIIDSDSDDIPYVIKA